jgi:glucose-6-phosphate-specific signal transduction histidine kinase
VLGCEVSSLAEARFFLPRQTRGLFWRFGWKVSSLASLCQSVLVCLHQTERMESDSADLLATLN